MSHPVIEGTWEEIERHKADLIGRQLRVIIKPQPTATSTAGPVNRPSAFGKYAFVAGGSEEFAEAKQAEIDREDRPR